jgi:hypothetical protein
MKFLNPKNGIVIEMPDDWSGDNWVPVEKPAPAPAATPKASAAEQPAPAKAAPKASTAKKSKK